MRVILEMANNHGGSVDNGVAIIEAFTPLIEEFPTIELAFKFQYRSPSILYPTLTSKLTERVRSTMLSEDDRRVLVDIAELHGFKSGCTPFDEESADMVKSHGYDFVKVASCSFTDWPLLERVATLGMPVIASTGGASDQDVERVVQFLKRRVPHLMLMHCVAEYPTDATNLRLDRIDWLKRFGCPVGLSTHEVPNCRAGVVYAAVKGAEVLEWHVDTAATNTYSLNVNQSRLRLMEITEVLRSCKARPSSPAEQQSIQDLRRGAFATKDLRCYDALTADNVAFQLPAREGQLTANDFGKYRRYSTTRDVKAGDPISSDPRYTDQSTDDQQLVQQMADKVQAILDASGAVLPRPAKLVLSHHKGLANFERVGCGMVECVNGEQYAKKLIVLLPGQKHPVHTHRQKEETFTVLWGMLKITKDGGHFINVLPIGQSMTIPAGQDHGFTSSGGCVFEEISTKLDSADSFYEEEVDEVRKTEIWLP